ncbi:hypothetical protein D3C71_1775810 [compost metagenome]
MPLRARHQRFDDGEDVLDAVAKLLVQHPLPNLGLAPLARHQLVVSQHHLDDRDPDDLGDFPLGLRPGLRLRLDCLLPDRKALAWCETVAEWTCLIGLFRIAGPVEGLDQFFAKKHQAIRAGLRKGNGENARKPLAVGRCLRELL